MQNLRRYGSAEELWFRQISVKMFRIRRVIREYGIIPRDCHGLSRGRPVSGVAVSVRRQNRQRLRHRNNMRGWVLTACGGPAALRMRSIPIISSVPRKHNMILKPARKKFAAGFVRRTLAPLCKESCHAERVTEGVPSCRRYAVHYSLLA